jgi:hypothetical protein
MITVIDNFLPQKDFQVIHDLVQSNEFPWYYLSHASKTPGSTITKNAVESFALLHTLYSQEHNAHSFHLKKFSPLLGKVEDEFNLALIRVRCGMKTHKKDFTDQNYNIPHVDFTFPHWSMVYYVNDSDGDTWVFDQMFTGVPEPTEFTVKQRVSPKPNRLLLIDGLQYHTASNPINSDCRVIININGVDKKLL